MRSAFKFCPNNTRHAYIFTKIVLKKESVSLKKIAACLGVFIVLVLISFYNTEDLKYKEAIVFSGSATEEEVNAQAEEYIIENILPSLEMILVDTDIINGNTVETYREYEIYKNDAGEVIKKVATDYYEYLEFWR